MLLKLFMKYVHPDFFMHERLQNERSINESNLKTLRNLDIFQESGATGRGGGSGSDLHKKTRSLTFYIKPFDYSALEKDASSNISESSNALSRRVRVSIFRVEESIREILQTIGCDISHIPEGKKTTQSFSYISASKTEIDNFLDSLIDRRDLMNWRHEHRVSQDALIDIVKSTLGVDKIHFRVSWSAQNYVMLLTRLLSLIGSSKEKLHLPWRNFSIIVTMDDCSNIPVDPLERHILINPAHVDSQLQGIFVAVNSDVIESARLNKARHENILRNVINKCNIYVRGEIKSELFDKKSIKSNVDDNVYIDVKLKGLKISIKKGFTCSELNFTQFIDHLDANIYAQDTTSLLTTKKELSNDSSPPLSRELHSRAEDLMINPDIFWLQNLPLVLKIIVEEGHGTKLMPNGEFRIDCRCNFKDFLNLLKSQASLALERTSREKALAHNISILKDTLKESLRMLSIDKHIGVNNIEMYECLIRIDRHVSKTGGGNLKALGGLKVRIAKYLGLSSDDGSVLIPFDIFSND